MVAGENKSCRGKQIVAVGKTHTGEKQIVVGEKTMISAFFNIF